MISEYIGIDIGASKIFAGRYTENGKLRTQVTIETPKGVTNRILLETLGTLITPMWHDHIMGIGVATAGFVRMDKGILVSSPNLPRLSHLHIASHIRQKWHVPSILMNDAKAFTFGESMLGKGKNAKALVGLTFGSGLGCGVVIDRAVFQGGEGFAGEVGHISLGKYEAEQILGGKFNAQYINGQMGTEFLNSVDIEHHLIHHMDGHTEIRRLLLEPLLTICETVVLAYNPQMIVIGGSVGHGLIEVLLSDLTKLLQEHLRKLHFPTIPLVYLSKLQNSGSLGAAMYLAHRRKSS